jgi:hypothetical protein
MTEKSGRSFEEEYLVSSTGMFKTSLITYTGLDGAPGSYYRKELSITKVRLVNSQPKSVADVVKIKRE